MIQVSKKSVLRRCLFDPGSGSFPYFGSQIPNPYFGQLNDKFLGKSAIILSVMTKKTFLYLLKNKIIYFMIFVATKINFSSSYGAVLGSGIRNPGFGMDTQH
jgi:hypothetical protein